MHNEERNKSDGISTNELNIVIIKINRKLADCNGVMVYVDKFYEWSILT